MNDLISRQAVLDIIRFEDKWLLDAKGHNADTEIAFSGMRSRIAELSSVKPQEPILDKIRAEVEQTRKMYLDMNDIDWLNGCDYVLSVIDKYKAETEAE